MHTLFASKEGETSLEQSGCHFVLVGLNNHIDLRLINEKYGCHFVLVGLINPIDLGLMNHWKLLMLSSTSSFHCVPKSYLNVEKLRAHQGHYGGDNSPFTTTPSLKVKGETTILLLSVWLNFTQFCWFVTVLLRFIDYWEGVCNIQPPFWKTIANEKTTHGTDTF